MPLIPVYIVDMCTGDLTTTRRQNDNTLGIMMAHEEAMVAHWEYLVAAHWE